MIEFLKEFNNKPIWAYNTKDWMLGVVIAMATGVLVAVAIEFVLNIIS